MRKLNELASIAVPIAHCQHDAVRTEKAVVFYHFMGGQSLYSDAASVKRRTGDNAATGKIGICLFPFCIVAANDMARKH